MFPSPSPLIPVLLYPNPFTYLLSSPFIPAPLSLSSPLLSPWVQSETQGLSGAQGFIYPYDRLGARRWFWSDSRSKLYILWAVPTQSSSCQEWLGWVDKLNCSILWLVCWLEPKSCYQQWVEELKLIFLSTIHSICYYSTWNSLWIKVWITGVGGGLAPLNETLAFCCI